MLIKPFKQISYDLMDQYFAGCFAPRCPRDGDFVLTQYGRTFMLTMVESRGSCGYAWCKGSLKADSYMCKPP